MDNFHLKVLLFSVLQLSSCIRDAVSGCCNDNYWCDGDPSFRLTPTASQGPGDSFVLIRWSSSYLNLAKCVDYFFIVCTLGSSGPQHIFPVNVEKNKSIDNWKTAIDDLDINYIANISIKADQHYVFTVFAIDKGAGWGELEGTARVSSNPINFKTRRKEALRRQSSNSIYPKHSQPTLSRSIHDWALYMFKKHPWKSKNGYDFLPDIWIRTGDRVQKYEEGKLYGMKNPVFEVSESQIVPGSEELLFVNITLLLPQLRTSYVWRSFFSAGVIPLYHTCGEKLPFGSFLESRKLLEVQSFLTRSNCSFLPVTVSLQLPKNISRIAFSKITPWSGYKVLAYHLNFSKGAFEFDVPWVFSHFHNLSSLWNQQKVIMGNQIMSNLEKVF